MNSPRSVRMRVTGTGPLLALLMGLGLGPASLRPAQAATAPAVAPASAPGGDAARGKALYENGVDTAGHRLQAVRNGAGPVGEDAVACVHCHRPSTRGGIEGGLLVPPISGDVLFAPGQAPSTRMNMRWMRHQTRSAYDTARFGLALRQGRDPDGQALGPEMPRYTLSDADVRDLAAYLRTRGMEATPGYTGGVLHLATVFTPDAPRARRDTVMQAMQAWSRDQRFGAVKVAWQPWVLEGPASGWREQLERRFRATPVFGLVSGAGGAHWEPVQAFCEDHRVACTFPSVDRLPEGPSPLYTTYFSGGVDAEARMLVQALAISTRPTSEVRQIWRGEAGDAAARTLAQALPPALRSRSYALEGAGSAALAQVPADAVLVLWLRAEEATAWLQTHRPGPERAVYLSGQLAPAQQVRVPRPWRTRIRWVSMRVAPTDFQGALAVSMEPWAQPLVGRSGLSMVDFADARAAGFLFGDAAGLTQGVLRPDFLLERLETAVRQRMAAAVYVQASLGPRQRVAAKGGHVLGFRHVDDAQPVQVSPYLRAELPRGP